MWRFLNKSDWVFLLQKKNWNSQKNTFKSGKTFHIIDQIKVSRVQTTNINRAVSLMHGGSLKIT